MQAPLYPLPGYNYTCDVFTSIGTHAKPQVSSNTQPPSVGSARPGRALKGIVSRLRPIYKTEM